MTFSRFSKMMGSATLALAMTLGFSGAAEAASEYVFYVGGTPAGNGADNDVSWFASGGSLTSTDFTGTIWLFGGGLQNVRFTSDQISYSHVPFDGWTGAEAQSGGLGFMPEASHINFQNGNVTGGGFVLTDTEGNMYNAQIAAGGELQNQTDNYFSLNNVTFQGAFNSSTFGGVNVSGFNQNGSFGMLEFQPEADLAYAGGYGRTEVTVIVPTPAAALAGLPMLGVLGLAYMIRRRRMHAA